MGVPGKVLKMWKEIWSFLTCGSNTKVEWIATIVLNLFASRMKKLYLSGSIRYQTGLLTLSNSLFMKLILKYHFERFWEVNVSESSWAASSLSDRRNYFRFSSTGKCYSLWVLGSVFGLISQEQTLFVESTKANIRYGKPFASATDEEFYEAARQANAYSFIMEMPSGFDTSVGERGVTVSGGQNQRITIVRALIKDP